MVSHQLLHYSGVAWEEDKESIPNPLRGAHLGFPVAVGQVDAATRTPVFTSI